MVDLSKVKDADKRREAERLFVAKNEAEAVYAEAFDKVSEQYHAKADPLVSAINEESERKIEATEKQVREELGIEQAYATYLAAETAYQALDVTVDTDWEDNIKRCAITGLALFDDDDLSEVEVLSSVVDEETQDEAEDRDAA